MENRVFNIVGVISFLVLIYCLAFDLFIGQWVMSGVIILLQLVQSVLYYYSRVKKKQRSGIAIYAACSYLAMIANYHYNEGIQGPTLLLFFLTFMLLIATSPKKMYKIWIVLHIAVATILVALEYYRPETVPHTYQSRLYQFMDILWTYIASIIFIFFIANYFRKFYDKEKKLADERLVAITAQNEQIKIQNLQLEKTNDEKNKLFSIVSHDLRAPIDTIRGYLEILSENLLNNEERAEMEEELLSQTKYTSDLLLNLLYWSKTQMQGVKPYLTSINLMEMVDNARSVQVAHAAKKGIKLTYNIDKEIEVIADKEMLKIVLRNIINNAIKFTKQAGEINIKLNRKESTGIISIQDNGLGIPLDKQKEIFTLKSDSTFGTSQEKGVGLGLMLCKEFMEYQNGTIWFESEPGKGSTFYISLPLARV